MVRKYKEEKYKGVRIGFVDTIYDGWLQPRDKYGNNLPAIRNPKQVTAITDKEYGETSGFTKKQALERMKKNIDRVDKQNSRLRKGYPTGTEELMAREW